MILQGSFLSEAVDGFWDDSSKWSCGVVPSGTEYDGVLVINKVTF
jgi:hypothetical protein